MVSNACGDVELDIEATVFKSSRQLVQVVEACLHSKGRSVGCVLMTAFAKAIRERIQSLATLSFTLLGLE